MHDTRQLNVISQYFDVNGIKLHAVTQDPVDKPYKATVVLLHGFPEFWYCWKNQIPVLGEHYNLIAPDMRGYNLSDKPAGVENYRMKHLVQDLLDLLQIIVAPKVTLVAHDWGGAVAWAFAAAHPERLEKLVILNSPHPSTFARELMRNPKQQESTQYMNLLRSERAEELLARNDFEILRKMMFNTMVHPENLTPEDRRAYMKAWSQPGAITGMVNWYRAMPMAPPDLRKGETQPQSATGSTKIPEVKIDVPTLVIWGMKDQALIPALLDGLEDYVAKLKIVRVDDASHWITHDAPDVVNRALLEFLAE